MGGIRCGRAFGMSGAVGEGSETPPQQTAQGATARERVPRNVQGRRLRARGARARRGSDRARAQGRSVEGGGSQDTMEARATARAVGTHIDLVSWRLLEK